MALRTRSRSTCLRSTSKGSTALTTPASHACAPRVHPAAVIGAGRGARSCGITPSQTSASTGLIPLRWKTPGNVTRPRSPGTAVRGRPPGADGPAQGRPADPGHRLSPGRSRPAAARSHGAEGAGSRTRCRRGSRRDDAPGTERRSCAHLLAFSSSGCLWPQARRSPRRGPGLARPGCDADFVTGWMLALDFVIGRRLTGGQAVRRRWRGASGAGARPPALPR